MRARLLTSRDVNPHNNLAREEALLLSFDGGQRDEAMLYLWQNAHTVVIGRNQNAWRECRTEQLEADGGTLARRTSGGGAVYHDLGNLNFSFILPRAAYDLERQLSVVRAAVRSFGVDCEFSGRNDLTAEGRKFSGNAFRFTKDGALHHGTLMVAVDPEKLAKYLAVSKEKLAAKGVKSVPSRVVNLSALNEFITVDAMMNAMRAAFQAEYGKAALAEDADALDLPEMPALARRNARWDWNYGATPPFDATFEKRFEWGRVEAGLSLAGGRIQQATVYTDAMDAELPFAIEKALTGCPFTREEMRARVGGEVGEWLGTVDV